MWIFCQFIAVSNTDYQHIKKSSQNTKSENHNNELLYIQLVKEKFEDNKEEYIRSRNIEKRGRQILVTMRSLIIIYDSDASINISVLFYVAL